MVTSDKAQRLPAAPFGQGAVIEASIAACREPVPQGLASAWREAQPRLSEYLQLRGDQVDSRELRLLFHALRDDLQARAGRIEGLLVARWQQAFAAALAARRIASATALSVEELQLVDLGEFDEDLAVRTFVRQLEELCDEDAYAVGRRVGALLGGRRDSDVAAACAPELIGKALQSAFTDAGFDTPARLELLRGLVAQGGAAFAAVYRHWNGQLVERQVLPDLKRNYASPALHSASTEQGGGQMPARTVADANLFAVLQRVVAGAGAGGAGAGSAGAAATDPRAPFVATAEAIAALDRLQRRRPATSDDATVLTEGVRDFRASDMGQGLSQLDAITVDIVAMLFELIYEDEAIADPIKVLIGRLQIPVLKVALADKRFFSTRAHPARRLLEHVSHAAVRLGRGAGHQDALYAKLAQIIERLQREFSHDTALFDTLCLELEAFLSQQEEAADAQAAAAVPQAAAQARRQGAMQAASAALAALVAGVPAAVAELLNKEWCELLALAHGDGDRSAWDQAMAVAKDLVASLKLGRGRSARKELVDSLPALIRRIQAGFDRLGVDSERRLQLIDALFAVHAGLLGGATATRGSTGAAVVPPLPAPVPATPVAGAEALHRVALLQRGQWLELAQANSAALRYRVSWISPTRSIFLLSNPSEPRGVAVDAAALALKIEAGQATIMPTEPIFERAVVRALSTLSDEEAAKISLDFT